MIPKFSILYSIFCLLLLSACASHPPQTASQGTFKVGSPYKIQGKKYYPTESYTHSETGTASWYGPGFHGKSTANGERFDSRALTAAHRTLQLPSLIEVTNLNNGKKTILRVNDRGPFAHNRILDVSERAAEILGFKNQGTAKVRIRVLENESKTLASAAKRGVNTEGMEIAHNNSSPRISQPLDVAPLDASQHMPPVRVASVQQASLYQQAAYQPAAQPRLQTPVYAPQQIYVQAGSFGNMGNAHALATRLNSIAPSNVIPVNINGSMYHRVRLGPFTDAKQAQYALSTLIENGQTGAVIISQ